VNLECCFVCVWVWPQRQTFVRKSFTIQNQTSAQSSVVRRFLQLPHAPLRHHRLRNGRLTRPCRGALRIQSRGTAIKWNILHDAKHPIDGTAQSFIEFFMRICMLCKLDPMLSAFLASEGTVITSGVTMYASSTKDALIDEALRNQRTPTKHVAGRIVFLPSLVSEHRNAIQATAGSTLPAHRTPAAPTGGSLPMSSAPSYSTAELNADASGRNFDKTDTAPLVGDAPARRPLAAPDLPMSSPYRIVVWILQRIQQDLGLALHPTRPHPRPVSRQQTLRDNPR